MTTDAGAIDAGITDIDGRHGAAMPGDAMPGDAMSRRRRLRLVLVLGSLIAIGPLTINLYLPALPAITADLGTTPTAVQATLTGTLLGLAFGQLLVGPLSDAFGRRRPLLLGLATHVLASALAAVAPNVAVLTGLRVLQGVGMAAAAVVAMAVVRDLFSGAAFARLLSRLLLVMGAAPILAPTIGSGLLYWTSWQGVFVALAAFGVLLIIVGAAGLPETLPPHRRRRGSPAGVVRSYGPLIRDRRFMALALVTGLTLGALFAYVAGSPFVLQQQYGLSEHQFGVVFGAGAASLITATQVNARLLRRYPPERLLATALVAGSLAGLGLAWSAATGAGGLFGLLVPLWLVLAAVGFVMPNAPAVAMSDHGGAAGTAAALLGAVQFGLGALSAPVVGLLGGDARAMGLVVAGALTAAAAIMRAVVVRPGRPDDRGRVARRPALTQVSGGRS
jgi:DHA1 family bicyclomycin/chloramphenicol resistance-like MFS transporter